MYKGVLSMFDGQLTLINKLTQNRLPLEIIINIAAIISGEQPYNLFCPITKYLISDPVSIARTEQGQLDPTIIYNKSSIMQFYPDEKKNMVSQPAFKALSILAKLCLKHKISITGKQFTINRQNVNVLKFLQQKSKLPEEQLRAYSFYRTLEANIANNEHGYISTVFSRNDKRTPIFLPQQNDKTWAALFFALQLSLMLGYTLFVTSQLYSEAGASKPSKMLLFIVTAFPWTLYSMRSAQEIGLASSLTSEFSAKPIPAKQLLPIVWFATAAASFASTPLVGTVYLNTLLGSTKQDRLFYSLLPFLSLGFLTQCLLSFVTAKMIFHSAPYYARTLSLNKNLKYNILALSLLAVVGICYGYDRYHYAKEFAPKVENIIHRPYNTSLLFCSTMISWAPKLLAASLFLLHKIQATFTQKPRAFSPEETIHETSYTPNIKRMIAIVGTCLKPSTRACVAISLGLLRFAATGNLASLPGYTGAVLIDFYMREILRQQIGASFVSLKTLSAPLPHDDTIIEINEMKTISKDSFNSYQTDSEERSNSRQKGSEHEEPLLNTSIRRSSTG